MNRKTLLIALGGLGLLALGVLVGTFLRPAWSANAMFANMPPYMLERMAENGMYPMMGMMGGWWMMGLLWLGAIAGIAALIVVLARTRTNG